MLVREACERLAAMDQDAELTVSVWDGDYCDENEVDDFSDWGSFVSIQHSRK